MRVVSSMQVTIVTSVFSSRLEQQQKAICSWLQLGFKVVSLNLAHEVDTLVRLFQGVEFLEVKRVPKEPFGSKIFIGEFFDAIEELPGEAFGIVNSDIYFATMNSFMDYVFHQTLNGMVFGSRIDVSPLPNEDLRMDINGFDYFFFRKSSLKICPHKTLALGMPLWDYWLPLSAAASGLTLKRLLSPVAFHEKHEVTWSDNEITLLWPLMDQFFVDWQNGCFNPMCAYIQIISNQKKNWRSAVEFIQFFLKYHTESIFFTENRISSGIVEIHESCFLSIKSALVSQSNQFESMKQSRSWRLTSVLRKISALYVNSFNKWLAMPYVSNIKNIGHNRYL